MPSLMQQRFASLRNRLGSSRSTNSSDTSSVDRANDSKLCEVCARFSFRQLASRRLPPSDHDRDPGVAIDVGSVLDIHGRRRYCELCELVAKALETQHCRSDGRVQLMRHRRFCTTEHITGIGTVTRVHTTRAGFQYLPPTATSGTIGPSFHYDQPDDEENEARYVLSLQRGVEDIHSTSTTRARNSYGAGNVRLSGRILSEKADPSLMQAWLHTCLSNHSRCNTEITGWIDADELPMLLVDVNNACVIPRTSGIGRHKYVALSYVWGRSRALRYSEASRDQLQTPGGLSRDNVPATIRDAISMVREMGLSYLWADAVCVPQDDPSALQKQISIMGDIYGNALFTIVAAHGDDANAGLPGVRMGSRALTQRKVVKDGIRLLTIIDDDDYYTGLRGSVWNTRAWTWQEKLLSSRMLIFTELQVYWRCREATFLEEVSLENVDNVDFLRRPATDRLNDPIIPLKPMGLEDFVINYATAAQTYRQRHMTLQSDMLNAFTGVSQMLMHAQVGEELLWGIPPMLFSYCLGWYMIGHHRRNHAGQLSADGQSTQQFPSWSWAAWCGKDNLPWLSIDPLPAALAGTWYFLQPEIVFYRPVGDGRHFKRVRESWDDGASALTANPLSRKWKGVDLIADVGIEELGPVNTTDLVFWTSVATIQLVPTKDDYKWTTAPFLEGHFQDRVSVWLGDVSHLRSPKNDSNDSFASLEFAQVDHITVDIAIIHRKLGDEAERGFLSALVIERRDDVAYRLGCAELSERDWIRRDNRRWECVTLR